jgi:hypothetical protein
MVRILGLVAHLTLLRLAVVPELHMDTTLVIAIMLKAVMAAVVVEAVRTPVL